MDLAKDKQPRVGAMPFRLKIYQIIGPSHEDSRLKRFYDLFMIVIIIASIVPLAFKESSTLFDLVDGIAVAIFIIDYLARLVTADLALPKWKKKAFLVYPFTPFAIIDLLSIIPSFTILNSGFRLFRLFRLFRALRVLRVLKLFRYSKSITRVLNVLKRQRSALIAVGTLAVGYILVSALVIFNVEPEIFHTFFDAVYWATISLTTVGYGDIYPVSDIGHAITILSSLFGIAVVALPAGIITAGYMEELNKDIESNHLHEKQDNLDGSQIRADK
ncbi:MAG: ion transporter [Eggerthellaceae bacterium]|nr:ion transporter [Eggerthellaceae bacterium]